MLKQAGTDTPPLVKAWREQRLALARRWHDGKEIAMKHESQTRSPVAIGHVSLRVTDIPQATQYFVTLYLSYQA